MKPEIELAKLVVDWSKIDDEVASKGWDGGDRDGEWDNSKNAMVSLAMDILDEDRKPKTEDVELKIVRGYELNGIVGIGFTVHPASNEKEGFISIRLIPSESCKIRRQALEPIYLFFRDLCDVISVFDGIEMSAEISKIHGVLPISRQLLVRHYIGEQATWHGFKFILSTAFGQIEGENWIESAEFEIDQNEAAGLREVIRHAMLLVGCGLPSNMRKAGE